MSDAAEGMTDSEIREGLRNGTLVPEITEKGRYLLNRYDELVCGGMGRRAALDAAERDANTKFDA